MSNHKNDNFDEIDLNDLSNFFNSIGDSIGKLLYHLVQYLKKNILFLLLAFIVGGGIGYLYKSKTKNEESLALVSNLNGNEKLIQSETVVVLNYGSYDYIKKILSNYSADTLLVKKGLINIQLKGIENLSDLKGNTSLLSLLSSKYGTTEELFAQEMVDKNFHYHTLTVVALEGFDFEMFLKELQQEIEEIDFIKNRKQLALKNLKLRQIELEKSIAQSNNVFSKGVKIEENNVVVEILLGKDKLIKELGKVELSILEGQQALFKVYSSEQAIDNNTIDISLEDSLAKEPSMKKSIVRSGILFVFAFIIVNGLIGFYRRYSKQVN
ncbi:hypothetical protein [Myroides phaeus]|uniref:hypothetical protein n=1 Tax=Myroides phaeus TaxID=702745 RepID=UPI001302FE2F|nr:hypothetical protein [Myroides phaeus]